MGPDKKRPAENTCRIVKGLDAVWAHFCPPKPCLPLSIDGTFHNKKVHVPFIRHYCLRKGNALDRPPHKPAIGDDIDAVIVSLGPNNSNDLSKGYTPLIDIKGLKWIKVKFAYYKQNGDPISLKEIGRASCRERV